MKVLYLFTDDWISLPTTAHLSAFGCKLLITQKNLLKNTSGLSQSSIHGTGIWIGPLSPQSPLMFWHRRHGFSPFPAVLYGW